MSPRTIASRSSPSIPNPICSLTAIILASIDRTTVVFLQITLNSGRTVEMKQRFYKAVADGLHAALKLRREDVFISLVEVAKENWSFGNGEAQYASPTP